MFVGMNGGGMCLTKGSVRLWSRRFSAVRYMWVSGLQGCTLAGL